MVQEYESSAFQAHDKEDYRKVFLPVHICVNDGRYSVGLNWQAKRPTTERP